MTGDVISVKPNVPLGEFLRSRRARLSPDEVGVLFGRQRRVPGLRREELADLAGLSVEYYTRLEQGRHATASSSILSAISGALRLSPAERTYLFRLAHVEDPCGLPHARVRPETMKVIDALGFTPAILIGPRLDVLAANPAARRLYADFELLPPDRRNAIDWMLSEPTARELHGDDWRAITAEMIGMLRLRAGHRMGDPSLQRLTDDLSAKSPFFREVWREQKIATGSRRSKRFQHREAGVVELTVESLSVAHVEEQTLVVLVPPPGSAAERAWHSVMAEGTRSA